MLAGDMYRVVVAAAVQRMLPADDGPTLPLRATPVIPALSHGWLIFMRLLPSAIPSSRALMRVTWFLYLVL